MSSSEPRTFKSYNGTTNLSGSASGQFGDRYKITKNVRQDERQFEDIDIGSGSAGVFGDSNHTVLNKDVTINNFYASTHGRTQSKLLTLYPHDQYTHPSGKRLALLAFDGGVIGGLSSLLALKHFMERVAQIQGLEQAPKPCEFFDMIAGVDVGGLLAILLGSLELTIDECIEKYTRFLDAVISKPGLSRDGTVEGSAGVASAIFDQEAVERFIKQVLRGCRQQEDRLFEAATAISCKVFVKAFSSEIDSPVLLRSFRIQTSEDARLSYTKLWHAVMATLATSPLFDSFVVNAGLHTDYYCSNPTLDSTSVDDIFIEAQTHLLDGGQSLEDHLDCLVSIGSRTKANDQALEQANPIITALMKTSSANEARIEAFCARHPSLSSSGRFCRLDIPCHASIHDWWTPQDPAQLTQHVNQYFNSSKVVDSTKLCLARLMHRQLTPAFAIIRASQQRFQPLVRWRSRLPRPHEISSYDAISAHYRRSQLRIKNTCTWILKDTKFLQWCQTPHTSVLVCTGIVGCGKSILAAAVIDQMQELRLNNNRICIHYFFEAGNNFSGALRDMLCAMIKQLIIPYDDSSKLMPESISRILRRAFVIQGLQPSLDDLEKAFHSLVDMFPSRLYLIDGFDDLDETQMQDMFGVLRRVFVDHNPHGSKVALFSREILGRGIEVTSQLQGISNVHSVYLSLSHVSRDIQQFVEVQVNEQQLRRNITQNAQLIKDIKTKLIENSGEMFLWIYFQIRTIWDPKLSKSDKDIARLIEDLPVGLDKTYEMCLRRLEERLSPHQREIAMKAFRWVSAARQPLNPRQMQEAVSLTASQVELEESDILNSPVTDYCGNLLTMDVTQRYVQFAHASVRQFLKDTTRIPQDLTQYYIDAVEADREFASICLLYLKSTQSRKQLAIRQNADISQKIPQMIKNGMLSHSSKLTDLAHFALKRTTRERMNATQSTSAGMNCKSLARLEMHDYILSHWLSHTSDIVPEDGLFYLFQDFCRYPDPQVFPWLNSAGPAGLYQQLTQFAIISRHLPLLKVLRMHLSTKMPAMAKAVFEDFCPGTGVRLIHMAAALNYVDAFPELARVCDLNAYDDRGWSAMMWAVEKSCLDTIFWLARYKNIDLDRTLGFGIDHKRSLCFLASIAKSASNDPIWTYVNHGPPALIERQSQHNLSQALYAACSADNASVANNLVSIGASTHEFKPFYWPSLQSVGRSRKSPLETAILFEDVCALQTLVEITEESNDQFRRQAVIAILNATAVQAWKMSEFLCTRKSIELLKGLLNPEWNRTIELTGSVNYEWSALVRRVLYAEQNHGIYPTMSLPVSSYEAWKLIPDDIAILLIDLGYLTPTVSSSYALFESKLFEIFLQRGSSRVLAKFQPFHALTDRVRLIERAREMLYHTAGGNYYAREQEEDLKSILLEYDMKPYSGFQHHHWFPPRDGFSISDLLNLSRCYRVCRGNGERARRMYDDLKDVGDNCDVSLNFPAGYMEINGRYMIKLSIVGAIYRWNHRLRRRKGLPFSAADLAYRKAVGLAGSEH